MPTIYIINGILISLFGFDHNPPHLHVKYGEYKFTITFDDRIVVGSAPSDIIKQVNEFMDKNMDTLKELWNKAQRGEKIDKINR
ncbi:MAG: DUF4160 domain-containing protein [Muribaculaceae bacterium]|nr:DUF4160 domain-containing protein [Muribaculaceae bacterium]